jgi:hypothetical protein
MPRPNSEEAQRAVDGGDQDDDAALVAAYLLLIAIARRPEPTDPKRDDERQDAA